ncbi:MAG: redoxin domain-containing protein [Deltaproteobacteria bacterium]|nr:redoxin domain-containing protein [Deltaproteobacteria bacterium]
MIQTGKTAPDFALDDQFGRKVAASRFRGKKHVLLLFYPLDFTPT